MFEGNLQHDAQEFLRCLLCYLQDAEKEVQKFYSQLPPRLSPRAVVLNPIMQRFLKAAQKIGKSQTEDTSNSNVCNIIDSSMKNVDNIKSDVVKVNLFPKSITEEKTEAAKSPSKIQIAPNLGDTASIVDKKSATDIQSGAVPKANNTESADKGTNNTISENIVDVPSANGGPSRRRGIARRGRKFTPYRLNSNLRCNTERKCEDAKLNEKNGKVKKGRRDATPDKFQPSISDIFVSKTYSSKKRLGMTSSVIKKTSEDLFDEMQNNSKGNIKQTLNTSGPVKSCSMPSLTETSKNTDLQPFVSLTDLQSKVSPEIKVERKSNDTNVNATSENCAENLTENSTHSESDTVIDKEEKEQTFNTVNEAGHSDHSRSFQDIFAQFLKAPECESDSDSVDLLTDSDNEDIVMQKKVAKQIHESPRRSPRKQLEGYQSSPRKTQSLEIQKEFGECSSPRKVLSFESKNKLSLNRYKTQTQSPRKVASITNQNNDISNVESKNSDELPNCEGDKNDNFIVKTETVVGDQNSPLLMEVGERNLFPVVKLEKCDHVFDSSNSKSVSANYASKCLTPQKNSPRKAEPDDSSNYLKRRNLLADFNIRDEKDLQRAIEEMYNSPVKSRSKCDLIERLFQGSMMLRTRCLQCESSRERREDFHDVSVPVRLEQSDSDEEEGRCHKNFEN